MGNNKNYNRNKHHRTDNNDQRQSTVHGGELKNGRLSQIKNNNPQDQDIPNEYVSNVKSDPEEEQIDSVFSKLEDEHE